MTRPTIIFVGNLDSTLFRQRLEIMRRALRDRSIVTLSTARSSVWALVRYLLVCLRWLMTSGLFLRPTRLVLHGAYSPILWPLVFAGHTRIISILQGSELNIDFVWPRRWIIRLILRKSVAVICRNEEQVAAVIKLCGVDPEKCHVVHWGLNNALFDCKRPSAVGEPVLISPRATQIEYNIPIIFEAIARLKGEGYRLRFIYVRFNAKLELSNLSIADEIVEEPMQEELWKKLALADICVSIPTYDGLSNTLLEALALGTLPIYSDIPAYTFLKQSHEFGVPLPLQTDKSQNIDLLYSELKNTIDNIATIRGGSPARRQFANENFRSERGIDKFIMLLVD
jgi:glycosyltransferase involved in cell wall biosynthesis